MSGKHVRSLMRKRLRKTIDRAFILVVDASARMVETLARRLAAALADEEQRAGSDAPGRRGPS